MTNSKAFIKQIRIHTNHSTKAKKGIHTNNKCTPQFTSRKIDRTSLVEAIKDLIKKINSEEEAIFNIREIMIEKCRNHEKKTLRN